MTVEKRVEEFLKYYDSKLSSILSDVSNKEELLLFIGLLVKLKNAAEFSLEAINSHGDQLLVLKQMKQ